MALPLLQVASFLLIASTPYFLGLWRQKRVSNPRNLPYPPGPKPWPIIGNLLDMPTTNPRQVYDRWVEKYGDVIHVEVLGTRMIFLESAESITALMEKKSIIYSDRPRLPMIVELMGWDWNFPMMNYGPVWRTYRKLFHHFFNQTAAQDYQGAQTLEWRKFLKRMLDTPGKLHEHIRQASGAIIMRIIYNIGVDRPDDPFVVNAEEGIASIIEASTPGAFMVDVLPILKYVPAWFPGAGFQKKAQKWRILARNFVDKPFNYVRAQVTTGNAGNCVASRMLEEVKNYKEFEDGESVVKCTTATAYSAGVDTSVSTMDAFFLAMVMYPEVQRKAQEELDRVVGLDNLPGFSHRESLPYVDAIVKETLRWMPVAPMGVPHQLMEDDEYNGYFLPKGSMVFGSAWSMLHDERMYPDPKRFNPDRFLKNGKLNPEIRDPSTAAFGFGRRICAGMHLATNGLFIAVASTLATFNIEHALDEQGNEIPVRYATTEGIFWYPAPFKCAVKPRSNQVHATIQQGLDQIERDA